MLWSSDSWGVGTANGSDSDHAVSRERLGYPETVRQLELRLARCHPSNRAAVEARLAAARDQRGRTVFDQLVEIFESRAPGVLRLK
jgi:hypothetical protein